MRTTRTQTKEVVKKSDFKVEWPQPLNIEPLCTVQLSDKVTAKVWHNAMPPTYPASNNNRHNEFIVIIIDETPTPYTLNFSTLVEARIHLEELAADLAIKARKTVQKTRYS